MSEEPLNPEVRVDYIGFLTCSKCGQSRVCASLASVAVDKTNYNTPYYSLALCSRCLSGLGQRIKRTGLAQMTPIVTEPEVDDID